MSCAEQSGRWFGAICAAPAVALAPHGLLSDGLKATAHPNFQPKLGSALCGSGERVVVSGNCVTSMGPGTSIEFALRIVALLLGEDKAKAVAEPMVLPPAAKL